MAQFPFELAILEIEMKKRRGTLRAFRFLAKPFAIWTLESRRNVKI
jgi:hypothetical protein